MNALGGGKERDAWLDNVKAILILCVVLGHFIADFYKLSPATDIIYKFIYFFHMPAFMYVTGYFSKGRIQRREYGKTVERVLLPYLVVFFLLALLYNIIGEPYPVKDMNLLSPLYALWFLQALTIYYFITPLVVRCRYALWIAIAVMLLAGLGEKKFLSDCNKVFSYYPFFLLGYYTSKEKLSKLKGKSWRVAGALFLVALLLFTIFTHKQLNRDILRLDEVYSQVFKNGDVWLAFWQTVVRILIGTVAIFAVIALAPRRRTFFTYVGTYSIYVYLLHVFIVRISRYYNDLYGIWSGIDQWYILVLYILCVLALAFLLASKPVRKLFRPIVEPRLNLRFLYRPPVMRKDQEDAIRMHLKEARARTDELEKRVHETSRLRAQKQRLNNRSVGEEGRS